MIKLLKLGSICKMQSGGTPRRNKSEFYKGGSIPWAKIGDIENANGSYLYETEELITPVGLDSINNRLFPKGTLLFAMYGSVGKTAIAGIELSTNQAILGIQPDSEILDIRYLQYWLNSQLKDLQNQSRGVALKNLSASIMKEQTIPLPPLPTQQKIAAILDKAAALRQNDKKILEKYDQLVQSVFLEMFGDQRVNPYNWPIFNLEDICEEIIDCPHSTPKYTDFRTSFPCIRTTELKNGVIDWNEMKYLDEDAYKERVKRLMPKAGDIVYGREGSFGEAAIIPENVNISLGQRVMLFRPRLNKSNSCYFHAMLRSKGVYDQALKQTKGSTVGHVNIKSIRKFKIMVPPLTFQTKYELIINKINEQKIYSINSLQKSEELFQSLLQRAFRGELV